MYKQPYLIQRLEQPRESPLPFNFGGGYKNGGLSEEAMSLLKNIFSFDYMGSAEFEFGELPRAFQFIARNHEKYNSMEFVVKTKENNKAMVYVLCNREDSSDVRDWIKKKASDEYSMGHTKERVGLNQAINDSKCRWKGWFDIDNGFFFFIDKEMFEKTKTLFEIEKEVK